MVDAGSGDSGNPHSRRTEWLLAWGLVLGVPIGIGLLLAHLLVEKNNDALMVVGLTLLGFCAVFALLLWISLDRRGPPLPSDSATPVRGLGRLRLVLRPRYMSLQNDVLDARAKVPGVVPEVHLARAISLTFMGGAGFFAFSLVWLVAPGLRTPMFWAGAGAGLVMCYGIILWRKASRLEEL